MGISLLSISQSYLVNIQNYSVEEGLSGRFVSKLQEDDQGFIWISTWLGLNRFDGYEFKSFPREKYGFKHERYNDLKIDKNGKIWLIKLLESVEHIDIFNSKNETVETKSFFSNFPFDLKSIHSIKNDDENNIWISLINGEIYKYDGKNVELIIKKETRFSDFIINSNHNIIILSENKKTIWFYDFQNKLLNQFDFQYSIANFDASPEGDVLIFLCDFDHPQFLTKWKLIHPNKPIKDLEFKKNNQTLYFQNKPDHYVNTFNFDKQGRLWISDYKKIFLFNQDFEFIFESEEKTKAYQSGLSSFYFDKNGITWGSTNDGIIGIYVQKNPFTNYLLQEQLTDTRGIAEDKEGNIYINQSNKTYRLNPKNGEINFIGINGSRGALFAENGKIYLGKYDPNIIEYNPETQKSHSILIDKKLRPVGEGNIFYQSKKTKTIYFGTSEGGLFVLDTKNQQVQQFSKINNFKSFGKISIHAFFENNDGIWIGTSIGLFLLDEKNGIIKEINLPEKDNLKTSITAIHQEDSGVIWLGTINKGIYLVSSSFEPILHLTTENGLSDNTIYAIYEDEFGYLWLPSNKGLMRINKKTKALKTYLSGDGIPHPEFNGSSHFKSSNGQFYFGGLKGLTAFNPKDFLTNDSKNINPPRVSQLEILDDRKGIWVDKSIDFFQGKTISLEPKNKSIKIKFVGLDLLSQDRNQFSYRKKGDTDWIFLEKNMLEIQNIPRGESLFEIRNRVKNGEWVTTASPIKFYRKYPFFMKTPFMLAASIAGLFLIYFLQKNAKKRKKQNDEKIKAAIQVIKESMAPAPEPIRTQTPSVTTPNTEMATPNSADIQWLKTLNKNANLLIDNGKFSIIELAGTMNIGERQFRRKLKQKIGISPVSFMREMRLQRAMDLLKKQKFSTVSEVSFAVGFSTPKHFSKLFQERFGKKPSSFLEKRKPNS